MINVKLNELSSVKMCFIGSYQFTADNPGPYRINLDNLSVIQANQILYNYRRGVLEVDNADKLIEKIQPLQTNSPKFNTPNERPIIQKDFSSRHKIEQMELELKQLLRKKAVEVIQTVPNLSISQLKRLLELEKQLKARKKIITCIKSALNKHVQSIATKVGTKDISANDPVNLGLSREYLNNISNIVESTEEQIVLNPVPVED